MLPCLEDQGDGWARGGEPMRKAQGEEGDLEALLLKNWTNKKKTKVSAGWLVEFLRKQKKFAKFAEFC